MNRRKVMICMMVVMLLGLGYSVPVNGQEAVTEQAKSETTENLSTERTTENTVPEENSSAEKTTEKRRKKKIQLPNPRKKRKILPRKKRKTTPRKRLIISPGF